MLRGVDLEVGAGESVAITGASGSGKTTLLSLLAGLDSPDQGEIWLCRQPMHQLNDEARAACRLGQVGFVFQDFQLVPGLTALENVMLPLELMRRADAVERARECLDGLGLSDRRGHYPPQLSGGEQQRVALARALAPKPRVLFADEPTGNLDEQTSDRLAGQLLNGSPDLAVVLVTHERALADRCTRSFDLHGGTLHNSH